eukprot:g19018.t1
MNGLWSSWLVLHFCVLQFTLLFASNQARRMLACFLLGVRFALAQSGCDSECPFAFQTNCNNAGACGGNSFNAENCYNALNTVCNSTATAFEPGCNSAIFLYYWRYSATSASQPAPPPCPRHFTPNARCVLDYAKAFKNPYCSSINTQANCQTNPNCTWTPSGVCLPNCGALPASTCNDVPGCWYSECDVKECSMVDNTVPDQEKYCKKMPNCMYNTTSKVCVSGSSIPWCNYDSQCQSGEMPGCDGCPDPPCNNNGGNNNNGPNYVCPLKNSDAYGVDGPCNSASGGCRSMDMFSSCVSQVLPTWCPSHRSDPGCVSFQTSESCASNSWCKSLSSPVCEGLYNQNIPCFDQATRYNQTKCASVKDPGSGLDACQYYNDRNECGLACNQQAQQCGSSTYCFPYNYVFKDCGMWSMDECQYIGAGRGGCYWDYGKKMCMLQYWAGGNNGGGCTGSNCGGPGGGACGGNSFNAENCYNALNTVCNSTATAFEPGCNSPMALMIWRYSPRLPPAPDTSHPTHAACWIMQRNPNCTWTPSGVCLPNCGALPASTCNDVPGCWYSECDVEECSMVDNTVPDQEKYCKKMPNCMYNTTSKVCVSGSSIPWCNYDSQCQSGEMPGCDGCPDPPCNNNGGNNNNGPNYVCPLKNSDAYGVDGPCNSASGGCRSMDMFSSCVSQVLPTWCPSHRSDPGCVSFQTSESCASNSWCKSLSSPVCEGLYNQNIPCFDQATRYNQTKCASVKDPGSGLDACQYYNDRNECGLACNQQAQQCGSSTYCFPYNYVFKDCGMWSMDECQYIGAGRGGCYWDYGKKMCMLQYWAGGNNGGGCTGSNCGCTGSNCGGPGGGNYQEPCPLVLDNAKMAGGPCQPNVGDCSYWSPDYADRCLDNALGAWCPTHLDDPGCISYQTAASCLSHDWCKRLSPAMCRQDGAKHSPCYNDTNNNNPSMCNNIRDGAGNQLCVHDNGHCSDICWKLTTCSLDQCYSYSYALSKCEMYDSSTCRRIGGGRGGCFWNNQNNKCRSQFDRNGGGGDCPFQFKYNNTNPDNGPVDLCQDHGPCEMDVKNNSRVGDPRECVHMVNKTCFQDNFDPGCTRLDVRYYMEFLQELLCLDLPVDLTGGCPYGFTPNPRCLNNYFNYTANKMCYAITVKSTCNTNPNCEFVSTDSGGMCVEKCSRHTSWQTCQESPACSYSFCDVNDCGAINLNRIPDTEKLAGACNMMPNCHFNTTSKTCVPGPYPACNLNGVCELYEPCGCDCNCTNDDGHFPPPCNNNGKCDEGEACRCDGCCLLPGESLTSCHSANSSSPSASPTASRSAASSTSPTASRSAASSTSPTASRSAASPTASSSAVSPTASSSAVSPTASSSAVSPIASSSAVSPTASSSAVSPTASRSPSASPTASSSTARDSPSKSPTDAQNGSNGSPSRSPQDPCATFTSCDTCLRANEAKVNQTECSIKASEVDCIWCTASGGKKCVSAMLTQTGKPDTTFFLTEPDTIFHYYRNISGCSVNDNSLTAICSGSSAMECTYAAASSARNLQVEWRLLPLLAGLCMLAMGWRD